MPNKPLSECLLYTFVDTAFLRGRPPQEIARQLCDGGSDLLQLRAKTSTADEIRTMGEILLPITRAAGVGLVINDHLEVAREVGAELCHLGQEDFFESGAFGVHPLGGQPPQNTLKRGHQTIPMPVRLGLSSHAPAEAERAVAAGADYIAVGPVYATGTKPTAKPVTLEYVRWAAGNVTIPWFAIGGINLENLDEVLAAGARRICVVSAILNAANVANACQKFKERLLSAC